MRSAIFTLLLFVSGHGVMSDATEVHLSETRVCAANDADNVRCIKKVITSLGQVADYIQQLRNLKMKMADIKCGLDTIEDVSRITNFIPTIGTVISAVIHTVDSIRQTFNLAYTRVQQIDSTVYRFRSIAQTAIQTSDTVIGLLSAINEACTVAETAGDMKLACCVNLTASEQKCIHDVDDKLTLLAFFGEDVDSLDRQLSSVLGSISLKCGEAERVTDMIINDWPQVSSTIDKLDDIYRDLQPILIFLSEVQDKLNYKLCIPNPIEVTSEAVEGVAESELLREGQERVNEIAELEILRETAEIASESAERAEEVVEFDYIEEIAESELINEAEEVLESVTGWFGKRRKRSLKMNAHFSQKSSSSIKITEEKANSMLAVRSKTKRAASVCFSLKEILVDSAASILVGRANGIIAEFLASEVLPSFDLPAFPSFADVNGIDYHANLSALGFSLDTQSFGDVQRLFKNYSSIIDQLKLDSKGDIPFKCQHVEARPTEAPKWLNEYSSTPDFFSYSEISAINNEPAAADAEVNVEFVGESSAEKPEAIGHHQMEISASVSPWQSPCIWLASLSVILGVIL